MATMLSRLGARSGREAAVPEVLHVSTDVVREATPWHDSAPPLPPALLRIKEQVHQRLVNEIDPRQAGGGERSALREAASALLAQASAPGIIEYRERILDELLDEALGLSVLEPLLRDDSITEIMVNGPDAIFVESAGRLYRTNTRFRDEAHLMRIVERIVSPVGRHVDEASPMVDARLADGSRVNIVVPPASPSGAKVTLRKFARQRLCAEDLVRLGTVSEAAIEFLQAVVQARLNILVSGGTGSGKTTFLNVLSSFIGENERIVTIEDPLELQLQQSHVVSLEARPPGIEGTHPVTQRDLVRNALRMRPDRIILGEVRGPEAFDMLQAMNTGHEGSISTVHANSPRDGLSRVENMVLMAGFDLPDRAIREQIASAVHLCMQVARLPDGSRKLTHITEIVGLEGQTLTLQDLFVFEAKGLDEHGRIQGALVPTGLQPHHAFRFAERGVPLSSELFRSQRWTTA